MSLERYFIFSSYAMFTAGFVMLASTRQLDTFSLALFAAVLITGWLIDTGRIKWSVGQRRASWLMVGGLAYVFIEWYALDASPVLALLHFVFLASSLKLLKRKTARDWLWLYVVTFCQALMTAGMMVDTTFFFMLVLYLFTAVSAFIGYEIHHSGEAFAANNSSRRVAVEYWRESKGSRARLDAPRLRSLPIFSAFALLAILLLATPLFLAMPRVSRGFSRSGLLRGETLSGFSDSVRLGEVAQVKLNPQVVMRVRVRFLRGQGQKTLRWRGVTLDHYDGQTWNYTGQKPVFLRKTMDGFRLSEDEWRYGDTEQRFFVEPLNINTVFAAPQPWLIVGLPELARDQGDGLWTAPHDYYKLDYTVLSDTDEVSDFELSQENSRIYPSDIQRRYLQLPEDHDQRIDQLAAEVTRGATTQIQIARMIESHLRTSYSYSLDLRRVESGDPVADFLFNTREGHCEYFASAMVLMLRSRRVPARLVNGFQMGEYNEAADVYTVRQSDAHSWVEVYFHRPDRGGVWVAFDPTPAAGLSVYSGGLAAWLRRHREAMEMFWLEHIIGFDANKQFSIAGAAQQWVSRLFSSYNLDPTSRWTDWILKFARKIESLMRPSATSEKSQESQSPGGAFGLISHPLTLALLGLTLTAITVLSWRKYGQSWRRNAKRDSAASAVAFYHEMLRALERAGYKRAFHQTPAEYAEQLRMPAVTEITNLYQQVRFGDRLLGDDEIARVSLLLRELRKR
jgi:transglutaminase-like putative cysteine protease/uncharacterized membrane protein